MAGTLFVVATPIGNLEDISARALGVLREVALIAAEDTRRTGQLLQRFGLTTPSTSFHEHNAKSKAVALLGRLRAGDDVALVSDAGTPGISDPGPELVRLAHEGGIRVIPIPGPSAVTAALSVSGFAGDSFVFLGFPPSKGTARRRWFERFGMAGKVSRRVVFYEAPHRVTQTLAELAAQYSGLNVFLARELTKVHEELSIGQMADIGPLKARGEFVVVAEFGDSTETIPAHRTLDADLARDEFGEMIEKERLTRRQAISKLSKKYGVPAREVYQLIEMSKQSAV